MSEFVFDAPDEAATRSRFEIERAERVGVKRCVHDQDNVTRPAVVCSVLCDGVTPPAFNGRIAVDELLERERLPDARAKLGRYSVDRGEQAAVPALVFLLRLDLLVRALPVHT